MAQLIDISPTLSPEIAVWPGDQKFSRSIALDFKNDDNLVLSSIQTTVHVGAHTDAPSHYSVGGDTMEVRNLDYYYGPCQVISVNVPRGERIEVRHLDSKIIKAPRVLFRTGSFPNPNEFNNDFNSLSPELVDFLYENSVCLVGIDTPSVDPFESKKLESHNQIFLCNMAILEGIVLESVEPGLYQLIALPLKIKDADASPVRAILVKEGSS